ncbi:uncharacterized protein LOC108344528 [Vigna angularis]|uniref:uncharacterized protein LOC108344528 n=1 Tax=Phaseolus angularis TaxID=3914 RepID=UPI000809A8C3|nr:uncharacterized protein LOC108344528 [Vigna angularis]
MTGSKEWFSDFEEGLCKTVKLGNNTTMKVVGKGSIRVKIHGFTQVISDVYLVPELKNNLLSLGQLQEKGLSILIQQGSLVSRAFVEKNLRGIVSGHSVTGQAWLERPKKGVLTVERRVDG